MNNKSNLPPNYTYAYGMLVLGIASIIAGVVTLKDNGDLNIYGMGTIFLGLLLAIQYLKAVGNFSVKTIRILTWFVVFGFLIVNSIILFL